ncbi:short-chain dehydrogenase [Streptomyces tuirus]|uniref:Short-chain dehydrogenase n=1 Tax=Streptomyces tuirus TaxID=68278 RepID=A0A941J2Y5_9ACTN|nr:short-chain dehydrogenase [Streptomyces tuirus]
MRGRRGDALRRPSVEAGGTGRLGTHDGIAEAAECSLDPGAAFVTGTDLLVDGGGVAALRAER